MIKTAILAFSLLMTNYTHCNLKISDERFAYTSNLPENTYHRFCKNIYSQNGEDGIIQQLLSELGIENGFFCEFGASNGITSSNTYNLIKNNHFSGMAIELSERLYFQCLENYRAYPKIQVFHGGVMYNDPSRNLNAWLKLGNAPYDLDLLSIDIDFDDYYVWDGLTDFAPKIIIFETNSYRDPIYDELPGCPSNEYNIDILRQWQSDRVACGCSFISAVKLGLKKGYIPVSYTGNITFVRKDLVSKLKTFPYKISDNPYDYTDLYTHLILWGDKWYTNTGLLLNVAIRDYFIEKKTKFIDEEWLQDKIRQMM